MQKQQWVGRLSFCLLASLLLRDAMGQGIFGFQNVTGGTPFVTGFTPVIGPNGAVGGVTVDAAGVIQHDIGTDPRQPRVDWTPSAETIDGIANVETEVRVIALSRLDQAINDRLSKDKALTDEMVWLTGLRRIDYLIADPQINDVLLIGPAGPWKYDDQANVVGVSDGLPVIRLDDLVTALRMTSPNNNAGIPVQISCSIEPTVDGQRRYANVRSKLRSFNRRAVKRLEQAMGDQQILIDGIPQDSHFARVMVSADVRMKRLAMGWEPSPIAGMPSYMQRIRTEPVRASSPRWWLTPSYQGLTHSPDRLVWHLGKRNVQTKTADSLLRDDGTRAETNEPNAVAEAWAKTMTENYDALSESIPVFGELKNCCDLAIIATLIAQEGLTVRSDCSFPVLGDATSLSTPSYTTPRSVGSAASLVKGNAGWIVSVSGGVAIDLESIVGKARVDQSIGANIKETTRSSTQRWWWNGH